jgi:hypothetical protein
MAWVLPAPAEPVEPEHAGQARQAKAEGAADTQLS